MTRVQIRNENVRYDADHDVLHVFFDFDGYLVDDEDFPGVFVRRSIEDNQVAGFIILDYKKRKDILSKLLPDYDFSSIQIH